MPVAMPPISVAIAARLKKRRRGVCPEPEICVVLLMMDSSFE
jgi:hypothetical protein